MKEQGKPPRTTEETVILTLVAALVVMLFIALIASVFMPEFRETGGGMVTAIGTILAAPVTAYIGLRFTRELRQDKRDGQ